MTRHEKVMNENEVGIDWEESIDQSCTMGCEWWTGEEWDWDMILIGTWCGFVRQYMMEKTRTIARNETRRGYETWKKRNGVSTAREWCHSIRG